MTKRKATSSSPSLLEPFEVLVTDGADKPSLGIVRDMVLDLFLDSNIDAMQYLVMLVLTDASPSTVAAAPVDGLQFSVRLADGDAIPKVDATLLYTPTTKVDQEAAKKMQKKLVKKKIKKLKKAQEEMGPSFYVASDSEIAEYFRALPFETKVADDGTAFVATAPSSAPSSHRMLALDCEMCKTTRGVELTRISIVDEDYKVLLDEFVLPECRIVDYCTQFSGITKETLEGCTNTLTDIQAKVLDLVTSDTILVGHSIENDLLALRLLHRRVLDTSLLYPHPKGPPFRSALRFLTATYLKLQIQNDASGHCSIEDATCTMKLAQLKIAKGPSFPGTQAKQHASRKLVNELAKLKKSALIVDSASACRSLAGSTAGAIPCPTLDKVVHIVKQQLTTGCPPHFTWARAALPTEFDAAAAVASIHAALPPASMLLVLTTPPTSELKELHAIRTSRGDPRSSLLWDKTMQTKLDVVATAAQHGVVQLFATPPNSAE
ncbi:hypothetical protein SPRG_01699 [Saprolegnia parasitica CBS 223.65]|uniref:Exonuclease domain-containing protein n=1 Tax=Saprolegnia parasitica (strain CBS 223.65) TaxID=695850 RepID=A0A067CX44_SAPPC|nr:hypothetical protein SPRG_01699 [Saprolegnia parasitica CBS 223.65]KDO33820.1 hypothetical protein SPRG_01699 [Saprolegnia parasitica CBS 223.65]|eukprot:XP_012195456.1 hypothetical protein SPRG_01699 [Saprolegnia parasitica CBS 223.65]